VSFCSSNPEGTGAALFAVPVVAPPTAKLVPPSNAATDG